MYCRSPEANPKCFTMDESLTGILPMSSGCVWIWRACWSLGRASWWAPLPGRYFWCTPSAARAHTSTAAPFASMPARCASCALHCTPFHFTLSIHPNFSIFSPHNHVCTVAAACLLSLFPLCSRLTAFCIAARFDRRSLACASCSLCGKGTCAVTFFKPMTDHSGTPCGRCMHMRRRQAAARRIWPS